MKVRAYAPGDEDGIAEIYNHYISNTVITFEEEPLSVQRMHERIRDYLVDYPWFVCELHGQIAGYSYASRFHPRAAYRRTVETTVYVRNGYKRRGIANWPHLPVGAQGGER